MKSMKDICLQCRSKKRWDSFGHTYRKFSGWAPWAIMAMTIEFLVLDNFNWSNLPRDIFMSVILTTMLFIPVIIALGTYFDYMEVHDMIKAIWRNHIPKCYVHREEDAKNELV